MFEFVIPSVSSFVRKTTEKIGTLHISPESRGKHEAKDDEQLSELTVNPVASPQEEKEWVQNHIFLAIVFAGCPEDSNLRRNSFKQNEELGNRFFQLPSFLWWVSLVLPTPFLELIRQWTQSEVISYSSANLPFLNNFHTVAWYFFLFSTCRNLL